MVPINISELSSEGAFDMRVVIGMVASAFLTGEGPIVIFNSLRCLQPGTVFGLGETVPVVVRRNVPVANLAKIPYRNGFARHGGVFHGR